MRVLGIETSGEVTGVALADGSGVAAELSFRHGMQLSRLLAPHTEKVLELAGVTIREVEGIAVSVGPGSFTGLRIGVTTAKSLAYALAVPVVGISALDALAADTPAPARALVCALMSATAEEVFAALYQWNGERLEPRAQEMLIPARDLAKKLAQSPLDVVLAGQPGPHRAVLAEALGPRLAVLPGERSPRPVTVALLGRERLLAGQSDPVHALAPRYLRASTPEVRRAAAGAAP
jgi:tRNA threonylcarbamoyladenosine biosynthesis protein TsaB